MAAATIARRAQLRAAAAERRRRSHARCARRAHRGTRSTRAAPSVVVLARAGQNLSEYGLRYSHLGFAYRDGDGRPAVWRVVHKLNQCGSARAALYRQGLGEFFLDDLWQYEAAIVVLAPRGAGAAARRCSPTTRRRAARHAGLQHGRLPVVASATSSRTSGRSRRSRCRRSPPRRRASAPRPGCACTATSRPTLHLSALKRLGARLTSANVAFDDHPNEKRFSDRIETVTVDSVFRWLERSGLGGPVEVDALDSAGARHRARLREHRLNTHADVAARVPAAPPHAHPNQFALLGAAPLRAVLLDPVPRRRQRQPVQVRVHRDGDLPAAGRAGCRRRWPGW